MIGLKKRRYQQTSSRGKAQAAHNEAGAIEVTCRCVINNTNGTFLPTTVPTGRCLFHRLLKGCLVWKHCKLIDVNTFYSVSGKSLRMCTNEPNLFGIKDPTRVVYTLCSVYQLPEILCDQQLKTRSALRLFSSPETDIYKYCSWLVYQQFNFTKPLW